MERHISVEDFFSKNMICDVCTFRSIDESIEHCADRQIDDICNSSTEDIVFSSDSLRSILEEDGHDQFRFYETELYTYPTKFLTKDIAKLFADEFMVDICWFSTKLHEPKKNEIFVQDYKADIVQYDRSLGKYVAFEAFDDSIKNQCLVKANVKYVEGEIAGKIIYIVHFPHADVLNKDILISSFIKKLVESGNRYGYDYISSTKSYGRNVLEFYISFESKRQESEIEIEDKLYHVSPLQTKDKILKFGLNPHGIDYDDIMLNRIAKRKNDENIRLHPYRVYLFNGFDISTIKSFLSQLVGSRKYNDKHLQKMKDSSSFCIFEIDRKKIPHLKLYRDNNFESKDPKKPTALYTYSNIPPNAIRFKDELHI